MFEVYRGYITQAVFCKVFYYRVFQMVFYRASFQVFYREFHKVLYTRYSVAAFSENIL